MTKEEAIRELIAMKPHIEAGMSVMGEATYDMAIEALQAQATLDDVSTAYENGYKQGKFEAQQWIPCSERLPEDGQEILATIKDTRYKNPVIIRHYNPELEEKLLLAWMPLPSPYKGEAEIEVKKNDKGR